MILSSESLIFRHGAWAWPGPADGFQTDSKRIPDGYQTEKSAERRALDASDGFDLAHARRNWQ
jgi:hypothetical protein